MGTELADHPCPQPIAGSGQQQVDQPGDAVGPAQPALQIARIRHGDRCGGVQEVDRAGPEGVVELLVLRLVR